MVRLFRYLLGVFCLGFLCGCTATHDNYRANAKLHAKLAGSLESTFDQVEKAVGVLAEELVRHYKPGKHCRPERAVDQITSVYVPKSGRRGRDLDCLMEAAQHLDPIWKRYHEDLNCLSWLYLYDSNSKALRIYPKTNPAVLFGDDLIFDSFHFYKVGVAAYPNGAWTELKFDINGTGKILIHSKALKLPKLASFVDLSVDLGVAQALRPYEKEIMEFVGGRKLMNSFLYIYELKEGKRTTAYHFSADDSRWRMLKSLRSGTFAMNDKERQQVEALEAKAMKQPLEIHRKNLAIDGQTHDCTLMRLKKVPLYSLMCHE